MYQFLANVRCVPLTESISHAFFKCARAKEVWMGLGLAHLVNDAFVFELQGTPIMETLLLNSNASSLLPEVRTCDLAAVATW